MPTRYDALLQQSQLFASLSGADREQIAELATERPFAADQVLFRRGDEGTELYIVAEGRIKVFLEEGTHEIILAYAVEGAVLGETSLLTGAPRSASATAVTDGCLVVIAHDDFQTYLASNARAMLDMARLIALRQVEANAYQESHHEDGVVRRVQDLRIQIDEGKRQAEVGQIVETEFFQQLQGVARRMRDRRST